jgi:hypothetical protein
MSRDFYKGQGVLNLYALLYLMIHLHNENYIPVKYTDSFSLVRADPPTLKDTG